MADLTTKYLGLTLRNPIIVGSSGLTNSAKKIKELEEHGAGAVVLKSIFEEEITNEYESILKESEILGYSEDKLDYLDYQIRQEKLDKYLKLISEAKKESFIPIIASINCKSSHEWIYFAKKFQEAGADALEINMFVLPTDFEKTENEIQKIYFDIIQKLLKEVSIPISLKISHYFTNLGAIIKKLSETGIAGLTLFNRFYSPDFDVDKLEVTAGNVLSSPEEITMSLRWIAMMSKKVNCDLAASTGVHSGKDAVKQILAGASAVQIVSTLYKNGTFQIHEIVQELKRWMKAKGFERIDDFKAKMSQDKSNNPEIYERVQFMKYFSGKKE